MINNESVKKIFGSNTRVKLLDLFFNNQDRKYYVREITRIVDEQINSVRRELKNLDEIGLIQKNEEDRKLYYSLNRKFELYNALCIIFNENCEVLGGDLKQSEKEITWNSEIKKIANSLKHAYISGQFMGVENDVDLLLIGNNSNNSISNWANELETKFNKTIKYVIMSADDFEYRKIIKDRFLIKYLDSENKKIY